MKISEFAAMNNVTAKMLRHYDEIGLLKPTAIDAETGYRSYESNQAHLLNWIVILKNLDFSLSEIKELLSGPTDGFRIIQQLIRKRVEIHSALNVQIQKKVAIDRLIHFIEKEGFEMDKKVDLLLLEQAGVHEIKKNIPNFETFLDAASSIVDSCSAQDQISVFRLDISHFKQVNDDYGFEVGDKVIVAFYQVIESNVQRYLSGAAIGRAHGDEFLVIAKAEEQLCVQTAQSIIDEIKRFDFSSIGCKKQMGCYIGGLVGHIQLPAIRQMVEDSIESLSRARDNGPNSIAIESYRA
ncbi:diguanylate cyclase domain-containing protein [Paenibacillus sp. OV219]|uniref:diguanylate cyclase domain-containing protein n=1 Tax=Paenibacillus sp. OV219 TaxID=1884377 RepID=UPI0008AA856C|nr:diguanylate cyclase [Paenibacillus sp. OV219]SEO52926.1 diguanylate cyclase (GGDEF) domain-containing protein [Paenibacillus sp. OV219]